MSENENVKQDSPNAISRRRFLGQAAAGAAVFSIVPRHVLGGPGQVAPSQKTTLAAIGTGGQGMQDLDSFLEFAEVQVVAVCDVNREGGAYQSYNWNKGNERRSCGREPARRAVDGHYADQQRSGKYKSCRAYADYRELLAKEDVDAVLIATPDHTHAVISMAAIKRGKHIYCEKPLTWSVAEARTVTEAARRAGVATQLGNHGQATEEARIVGELIADGAIGPVREIQTWYGQRFWNYMPWEKRPAETPPVPDGLDWDLWLGPAPERPYHPEYTPWTWRNWRDFGTGLVGDLGCHKLSAAFKALKLGHPVSIEASATNIGTETYPMGEIMRFEFPARGEMPPLTLTWHDGGLKPATPKDLEPGRGVGDILYIGDKGTINGYRLIPDKKMQAYGRPPRTLPRSPGHFKEFVDACRGGAPAGSNFVDHSGLLSEVCLLGNIAVQSGKKLLWDGAKGRFTNNEAANKMLQREYRKGWSL